MSPFTSARYVCAVRTRRAELSGLGHVKNAARRGLLPVFELSKSRRSKSNPDGSVELSVADLLGAFPDAPFIADVTSLANLLNAQVEALLDPEDCFSKWRTFVRDKLPPYVVPVVHLEEPFNEAAVRVQLDEFLHRNSYASVRIPSDFQVMDALTEALTAYSASTSQLALLADVGMVLPKGFSGAAARVAEVAGYCADIDPGLFASLASSFPSSVTQLGGDESGQFDLQETRLSSLVANEFDDLSIAHGDYGCIHPLDMEGMAINWVPRIDVPLDTTLFYHRYRRDVGGYIQAAQAVLRDARYAPIDCWAHDNIAEAAIGSPRGKAPAHWISVRLNLHIERQLLRLA